jgi:acyl carrier protein
LEPDVPEPDVDVLEADVLAEIRRIVAQELEPALAPGSAPPPAIELESALTEFPELDSLGRIVLAVGLEDRFRIKLMDADAAAVVTVGDLATLVVRRVRERERTGTEAP